MMLPKIVADRVLEDSRTCYELAEVLELAINLCV